MLSFIWFFVLFNPLFLFLAYAIADNKLSEKIGCVKRMLYFCKK